MRSGSPVVHWILLFTWVLLSPWSWGADAGGIESYPVNSSEIDTREYQYLVLPNQLRVLLISDPDSDKAAAAMDVGIGSNDDPPDRGGLAHFLEHMLFLGTEKYPQPDEYQQFISSHGGSHNAFTSGEHTNYFFDVEHSHLDAALDRFAQFFIAPLFTPQYVDRERNAVHSEFRARYRDDYRRQRDVYRQIVRPQHPLSKFNVGSLETLADRDDELVREDLLSFYSDYYSASNMTLVVLGRESLGELRNMVIERFRKVPRRDVKHRVSGEALFAKNVLPLQLEIKPLQTVRRLTLSFPVPVGNILYRQKPLEYLGNILGHEGEGSLLSLLKSEGWAEGLSAGGHANSRNQDSFDISISLTEDGYEKIDLVVAAAFEMIDKLRRDGVEKWRYREQSQLSDMAFRFAEKREASGVVSRLAGDMHEFKPVDVLRGHYAFDDYDAGLIRRYLKFLSKDNLLQVVVAPEVTTNQKTPLYKASYRQQALQQVGAELQSDQRQMLALPGKNSFVPGRLTVKALEQDANVPQLIASNKHLDVWYKQDERFRLPKAEVRLRVYSPAVASGVQPAAMGHLFTALVGDQLNEFAYPAQLAGLSFNVRANSRGFDLLVSGYNERQGLLFSRMLDALDGAQFERARFDSLKRELIRNWRNQRQLTPYEQLFQKLPVLLYSPLWDQLDMADALTQVSYEQFKRFTAAVWQSSRIQMLAYGNLFRQEALKFASIAENRLYKEPQGSAPASLPSARVVDLPAGIRHLHLKVEHRDVAAMLYLQAASDSTEDRAAMLMLRQMFSSSFFHSLRTEKQLGYVVFLTNFGLKDVEGNVFLVQSPATPLSLVMEEILAFVHAVAGSTPDFELHRRAVLAELTEAPKNIDQQADRYWSEIVADSRDFSRRQDLIAAVEALRPEALAEYGRRIFAEPQGLWLTAAESNSVEDHQFRLMHTDAFDFRQFKGDANAFVYP